MKIILILASFLILSFAGIQESFSENSTLEPIGNFTFMKNHYGYKIPYEIINGTVTEISMDCKGWDLLVHIESDGEGILTVDIPIVLMDPFSFVTIDYERAKKIEKKVRQLRLYFQMEQNELNFQEEEYLRPLQVLVNK